MPRLNRAATVVEAHLNEVAKSTISEHNPSLLIFDPYHEKMRRSLLPEELQNMA
jgi:hypothetical protein